jgi:hypothetical protein
MSDMGTRRQLLASVEQHEREMASALVDLKRAVARPFDLGQSVGEQLGTHPLPWLAAATLVGLWLGSRSK